MAVYYGVYLCARCLVMFGGILRCLPGNVQEFFYFEKLRRLKSRAAEYHGFSRIIVIENSMYLSRSLLYKFEF